MYLGRNVPNLDGGEGHSEYIIFGTNIDLSVPSDDGLTHPVTENEATEQDNSSETGTPGDSSTQDGKGSQEGDGAETTTNVDKLVSEFTTSGDKKEGEDVNTPVDSEQPAKL